MESSVSAIYFCFYNYKHDSLDAPNKILLSKSAPTVSDLCDLIQSLFLPGHEVTISCSFSANGVMSLDFPSSSIVPLPINNRNNLVIVKTSYPKQPVMLNNKLLSTIQFLALHGLDTDETVNIFAKNRIYLDNFHYLTEQDLIKMGINEWGTRISILEAIKLHLHQVSTADAAKNAEPAPSTNPIASIGFGQPGLPMGLPPSFSGMALSPVQNFGSRLEPPKEDLNIDLTFEQGKVRRTVKFKDLTTLVNHPFLPVHLGSRVTCSGSNAQGIIVLNKQKRPMIEWVGDGQKKLYTISQFFRAATNSPLLEKGDSWSQIFFQDSKTNTCNSLAQLKYLLKGPKKPVSGFLFFASDIRNNLPNDTEFARKSGEMWKDLSEAQKEVYKQKEARDKTRFAEEKQKWQSLAEANKVSLGLQGSIAEALGTDEATDDGI